MAVNPYFQGGNGPGGFGEQLLLEDLIIESIKVHGMDMLYLPRSLVTSEELLEARLTTFDRAYLIEFYLENVEDWEGEQEFISKFGLEVRKSATLLVARKRFQDETFLPRPVEGDLIYWPLTGATFVVKFVEDENPFYQIGKLYVFKLSIEQYEFSHENFQTGVEEVDDTERDHSYRIKLDMNTDGTGNFLKDDRVYQGPIGTPTALGEVSGWDKQAGIMYVRNITGYWTPGPINNMNDNLVSGWVVFNANDHNPTETAFAQNDVIEEEADAILDFTEENPFGDPSTT